MLILTRAAGETVNLYAGDTKIEVVVLEYQASRCKLGITAPKDVLILRKEVDERIKREKQADVSPEELPSSSGPSSAD